MPHKDNCAYKITVLTTNPYQPAKCDCGADEAFQEFIEAGEEIRNELKKQVEESEVVYTYDSVGDMHYINLKGLEFAPWVDKSTRTWAIIDTDGHGNVIGFEIFGTKR